MLDKSRICIFFLMNTISKINSLFLALAVVFSTFGQVQTLPGGDRTFTDSKRAEIPAYSDISANGIRGVINLDGNSSLFNVFSNSGSEEDRKYNSKTAAARESALTKISSVYLLFARNIALSPSISDLLYPFHFYF